jgi:hypothetical protein
MRQRRPVKQASDLSPPDRPAWKMVPFACAAGPETIVTVVAAGPPEARVTEDGDAEQIGW